jgi:hypothetical protein
MRLSRRDHVILLRKDGLAQAESRVGKINQVKLTRHSNRYYCVVRQVQSLAVWNQSLGLWTLGSEMQTARIGTHKFVDNLFLTNEVSLSSCAATSS